MALALVALLFVRFRRARLRRRANVDGGNPVVVLGSIAFMIVVVAVMIVVLHR